MKEVILKKLKEIEEKEQVKILFAVESGSRAWGFASPDSDYDVRFVYKRRTEEYLRLDEQRDVIEWQLDDTLDINGWDLKKAMQLLHKSNPALYEWTHSPIVYYSTDELFEIRELIEKKYSKKRMIKHYCMKAKGTYENYLRIDDVKLKKYFYALRPLFAAKWIIDKDELPPIEFNVLVNEICPKYLLDRILKMIEIKKSRDEKYLFLRDEELNQFIEEKINEYDAYANSMEEKETDWDLLNDEFRKLIMNW